LTIPYRLRTDSKILNPPWSRDPNDRGRVIFGQVTSRRTFLITGGNTRRMLTVEQGAVTSVYCSTSLAVEAETGLFYDKSAQRTASPVATQELARQLWKHSAEWTGLGFDLG